MTASSTCIKDVAVDNLPRSASPTLLEPVRKLLLTEQNPAQKKILSAGPAFAHLCDRIRFFMFSARTKL